MLITMENDAEGIFRAVVKGKNIMTPVVIEYGFTPAGLVYELTKGEGMEHQEIFGVTFVCPEEMEHLHDISKMVYTRKDARALLEKN